MICASSAESTKSPQIRGEFSNSSLLQPLASSLVSGTTTEAGLSNNGVQALRQARMVVLKTIRDERPTMYSIPDSQLAVILLNTLGLVSFHQVKMR